MSRTTTYSSKGPIARSTWVLIALVLVSIGDFILLIVWYPKQGQQSEINDASGTCTLHLGIILVRNCTDDGELICVCKSVSNDPRDCCRENQPPNYSQTCYGANFTYNLAPRNGSALRTFNITYPADPETYSLSQSTVQTYFDQQIVKKDQPTPCHYNLEDDNDKTVYFGALPDVPGYLGLTIAIGIIGGAVVISFAIFCVWAFKQDKKNELAAKQYKEQEEAKRVAEEKRRAAEDLERSAERERRDAEARKHAEEMEEQSRRDAKAREAAKLNTAQAATQAIDPSQQPHYLAIAPMVVAGSGQLSFNQGDIIILVARVNNDWFYGSLNGSREVKMVPFNHVQLVAKEEALRVVNDRSEARARVQAPLPSKPPPVVPDAPAKDSLPSEVPHITGQSQCTRYTTLFVRPLGDPAHLTFDQGLVVLLVQRVNDDWFYGALEGSSEVKLVPFNHVEAFPPRHAPEPIQSVAVSRSTSETTAASADVPQDEPLLGAGVMTA